MIVQAILILIKAPLNRERMRWPAIMLAVIRNVNATGRIRFLSTSTTTMNLTRGVGVPIGTRWAKNIFKDLTHLNKIILNHMVKASGRVIIKCEVAENRWGNRAIRFNLASMTTTVVIVK